MKLLGTGDIAEKTGLTSRQVAAYAHSGLLPKPTSVIHAGNREIPVWAANSVRSFITRASRGNLPVTARTRTRGQRTY